MIVLGLRIIWQVWPGLMTCGIFWGAAITFGYIDKSPFHWLRFIGVSMNALVCMANGGFMPYIGNLGSPMSVWKHAADTPGRLLWLCDRLPWGFSIGDCFIITGLLAWLTCKLMHWGVYAR